MRELPRAAALGDVARGEGLVGRRGRGFRATLLPFASLSLCLPRDCAVLSLRDQMAPSWAMCCKGDADLVDPNGEPAPRRTMREWFFGAYDMKYLW